MKHVIGYGRGETTQGLLIFAAVFEPDAPGGHNARILRFCDEVFDVDNWRQHNLFFEGSVLELGFMAIKRLDPSLPMKIITVRDYDFEVVRDMYEQIVEWLEERLARPDGVWQE